MNQEQTLQAAIKFGYSLLIIGVIIAVVVSVIRTFINEKNEDYFP